MYKYKYKIKETKITRRDALSTMGKIAIGVVVAGVIAGVGGYIAGSSVAPTKVLTETRTLTVPERTVTVTETITAPGTTVFATKTVVQTAPVTAPSVTLKIWAEAGVIYEMMRRISEKFKEEYPNISFEFSQNDTTSYQQAIFTRFRSPDAPDIAWMWGGLTWVPDLVDAGLIRNMDDFAERYAWRNKLHPAAFTYLERGSFYFIPHHGVTYPYFYYNVDLFQKQGWSISEFEKPLSIEEFIEVVKDIKKSGYLGVVCGVKDIWPAEHLLSHFIVGVVPREKLEKFIYSYGTGLTKPGVYKHAEVRWDDPDIVSAFEELKIWGKEVYAENIGALDYSSALSLFTTGKAAIWQDGIWSIAGLKQNIKGAFTFDMMQIPTHKFKAIQTGFFNGWVVSSKTKYPEICAEWIDFAYSPKGELIAASLNFIPGTKDVPLESIEEPFLKKAILQITESPKGLGYYAAPSIFCLLNGKVATSYRKLAAEVALGLKEPKDAIMELEELSRRIAEGE